MQSRHYREINRYNQGKLRTRIGVVVLLCLLFAATLGIEYWGFWLLDNGNAVVGLLVLIILLIAFGAATLEYCGLYCYLGFKMFFVGTVVQILDKIEKRKRNKRGQEYSEERAESEQAPPKVRQWPDLFVAIFSLALAVGLIVAVVALAAHLIDA